MAGSLLLFLIPLAVACIAIVVRYAIENRKPPGTRHLPGPWGETTIDRNDLRVVLLTTYFRAAMDRKSSWYIKVLCLVWHVRMG